MSRRRATFREQGKMKIAFIGTHGTGKTTLAHETVMMLKKKGIDAGMVTEVARQCPFPIREETTKKSQIWIILNQIIKELEAEEKYEVVVSDRSVLDGYCYLVRKFGRMKVIEDLVKEHLTTYDTLIRVPIEEGFLKEDRARSANKKFQEEVDNQFDRMIDILKVKHVLLENRKSIKEVISTI